MCLRHLVLLKWIGVAAIVLAAASRSFGFHLADLLFSLSGALIWTYVGFRLKDNALLAVNGFIVLFMVYGVFK